MQVEYDSIDKEKSKTATELAYAEVIHYNKKNLERELQNESRQHNRQQSRSKQREEYGCFSNSNIANPYRIVYTKITYINVTVHSVSVTGKIHAEIAKRTSLLLKWIFTCNIYVFVRT